MRTNKRLTSSLRIHCRQQRLSVSTKEDAAALTAEVICSSGFERKSKTHLHEMTLGDHCEFQSRSWSCFYDKRRPQRVKAKLPVGEFCRNGSVQVYWQHKQGYWPSNVGFPRPLLLNERFFKSNACLLYINNNYRESKTGHKASGCKVDPPL